MHTSLFANAFPSMVGCCSSLLLTKRAFLIHSLSSFKSLLTVTVGDGWLMQLCSFFYLIKSTSTVPFTLLSYNNNTLCWLSKTRSKKFFSKKHTEQEVSYTLLRACSITDASLLQFCFSVFSHHWWRNPCNHRPLTGYYIKSGVGFK